MALTDDWSLNNVNSDDHLSKRQWPIANDQLPMNNFPSRILSLFGPLPCWVNRQI
jgi:hypothetical protein